MLGIIRPLIEECDYIVGHNVIFDINVLNAEFYRYDMILPVSLKPYLCTMMLSKDYCGFPNNKYPTLEELSITLKGESYMNAHNAMADTQTAMECFWILIDSGIVNFQKEKPITKIYPTEDNISWAGYRVSKEYATKAHAFLTIASNLKNNKKHFLNLESDLLYVDMKDQAFNKELSDILGSKRFKELSDNFDSKGFTKDCRTIKISDSNQEWIYKCFKFSETDLKKTYVSVKVNEFNGNIIYDATSPLMKCIVNDIKQEIGIKNIIERFHLNRPECCGVDLILEDESCWIDIAIKAVNNLIFQTDNIDDTQSSHDEAGKFFISMIKYINEIRLKEKNKKWERAIEGIKNPGEEAKNIANETLRQHDCKKSSSNGCMLLFSVFVGISSFLCFIITLP